MMRCTLREHSGEMLDLRLVGHSQYPDALVFGTRTFILKDKDRGNYVEAMVWFAPYSVEQIRKYQDRRSFSPGQAD
jgi:hypothetical protein